MTNVRDIMKEGTHNRSSDEANEAPKFADDRLERLGEMRSKANAILQGLQRRTGEETAEERSATESWRSEGHESSASYQRRYFRQHGFILIPGFADIDTEVVPMKEQMQQWVDDMWDVEFDDDAKGGVGTCMGEKTKSSEHKLAVFQTDEEQEKAQGSNTYFLDSASKIHFFAEKDALSCRGKLKQTFRGNKIGALNKVGHGMHMTPGVFRSYSTSSKIRHLVKNLGWNNPVIPQSMYILKSPRIGGEVTSHQDSTFLFTTPRQTCLGLWLALDDATLENGCLWVRPGSHTEPLRRKFVRNPEYFGDLEGAIPGNPDKPLMIFEDLLGEGDACIESVPWEGKLPHDSLPPPSNGLFEAGFVPVECRAGDLVVFPGQLDHLSLPNHSKSQRHTFQLHLVEGDKSGVVWSDTNWLQYPKGKSFLSIKLTE